LFELLLSARGRLWRLCARTALSVVFLKVPSLPGFKSPRCAPICSSSEQSDPCAPHFLGTAHRDSVHHLCSAIMSFRPMAWSSFSPSYPSDSSPVLRVGWPHCASRRQLTTICFDRSGSLPPGRSGQLLERCRPVAMNHGFGGRTTSHQPAPPPDPAISSQRCPEYPSAIENHILMV
jgi:hypothetical protein